MKNYFKLLIPFAFILLMTLTISCLKEEPLKIPTVVTLPIKSITSTSAIGGGDVTSYGGTPVTARGVCWSINENPTIEDSITSNGAGIGNFTSNIIGLKPGTKYYVRAYAINSIGTAYGSQLILNALAILPNLTTSEVTRSDFNSVSITCTITDDGGASIINKGLCFSTHQKPTISDSKIVNQSSLNSFTSTLSELTANSTYYARAYATNSVGTAYGNLISFNTFGTVSDIEGNVYRTILIGTQTWMAENLKTKTLRTGYKINTTTPYNLNISNEVEYPAPLFQWAYGNDETKAATYGRLYTLKAAISSYICPTGWHVPTNTEWITLSTYLGDNSGSKMRETGSTHWKSEIIGTTNSSGFTALPAGERYSRGEFWGMGTWTSWWSTTQNYYNNYSVSALSYNNLNTNYNSNYAGGSSIRCVKN